MTTSDEVSWDGLIKRLKAKGEDHLAWCNWFTGYTDATGTFTYGLVPKNRSLSPFFSIAREQNINIIREIRDVFLIGNAHLVRPRAERASGIGYRPRMQWDVKRKEDLPFLITFFDRFPLRSQKREDFEIWRILVNEYVKSGPRSARLYELGIELSSKKSKGQSKNAIEKLKGWLAEMS